VHGTKIPVGKLILSPTRTYLPVLKKVLEMQKTSIHGIIHCTGGAQTKVKKFIKNIKVIKDNLLPVPPLFELIKAESGTDYKEMFEVFNMGHRLEFYVKDQASADAIIAISEAFNIDAQVIGRVEESHTEEIEIVYKGERFKY